MATFPSIVAIYSPRAQSGKTTTSMFLQETYGYKPLHFATPMKTMFIALLMSSGFTQEEAARMAYGNLKEEYIPAFKTTPRHMLQTLGTEWGRNMIHPDLWVNLLEKRLEQAIEQETPIVIDDMRFPNEFEMINRVGGHTIKVMKRSMDQIPVHDSEGALTHQAFDNIIVNEGTLEDLRAQVSVLFEQSEYPPL